MGFDLYGLNPTVNKKYPPRYNEIMEEYGKDGMLNWKKDIPEDIKDEYFELKDNYEEENPGSYFRNNVWFWRPLWSFVCVSCDDFLKEKDMSNQIQELKVIQEQIKTDAQALKGMEAEKPSKTQ